jgi:hypothetical protein
MYLREVTDVEDPSFVLQRQAHPRLLHSMTVVYRTVRFGPVDHLRFSQARYGECGPQLYQSALVSRSLARAKGNLWLRQSGGQDGRMAVLFDLKGSKRADPHKKQLTKRVMLPFLCSHYSYIHNRYTHIS